MEELAEWESGGGTGEEGERKGRDVDEGGGG
jgi:hypothetical protein